MQISHAPGARSTKSRPRRILALTSKREAARVSRLLRAEVVGGLLVLAAGLVGFIAANSPLAENYFALRDLTLGPEALHLDLSVGAWASDGLLAIFFFMVGLELKREFIGGSLSRLSTAIVPVAAAFGGVIVPALIFVAFTFGTPSVIGWAIPTATDIAFAVAVLGLLAPRVPPALRMFLLTLAVVDDLIAISIIAIFFTTSIKFVALLLALVPLAAYILITRKFTTQLARSAWAPWVILLPLGIAFWACIHASGIHATVAGVILAAVVPVRGSDLAGVFEHRFRPLSSGIAVPIFAFFAAGVAVGGGSRFPFDPIAAGVLVGLVLGKPIGITLTTWLMARFTRAELDPALRWREVIGIASLAGIGFTVALLVTDLSYANPADADTARLAVMAASVIATGLGAVFLVRRPRSTREMERELEGRDTSA